MIYITVCYYEMVHGYLDVMDFLALYASLRLLEIDVCQVLVLFWKSHYLKLYHSTKEVIGLLVVVDIAGGRRVES